MCAHVRSVNFVIFFFFFFNDTATTEIYTLSLHDALPIYWLNCTRLCGNWSAPLNQPDRKSTRLNSSHLGISYAVFCLKKKKKTPLNNESRQHNHYLPPEKSRASFA